MLKIFIYAYDKKQFKQLYNLISKYLYFKAYDIEIEVIIIESNNILDSIEKNDGENLYFIDINLNRDVNRTELISKIRKHDLLGTIVFVITHTELSYSTYIHKIEDIEYISKEYNEQFIFKVINFIEVTYKRYTNKRRSNKNSFIIKSNERYLKIYDNDVNFIESSHVAHKLILHTSDELIEFYGRIKDLDKKSKSFYRCHNSYIVNINNIDFINTKSREINMKNGQICYASVRYIKKLLVLFENTQN